jgi:hypothetical protein
MPIRFRRPLAASLAASATALLPAAGPAQFLYWQHPPALNGAPVTGEEPGIDEALPGAKPAEVDANLLWTMRGGLNVAALQCGFAPGLLTSRYYNEILHYHAAELKKAYGTLSAYFKRTGGKAWQNALDQYNTRSYNSFSTLQAQVGFCETAAAIDREAMTRGQGQLILTAKARMRELRNSLKPVGDNGLDRFNVAAPLPVTTPPIVCVDKKDRVIDCYTNKRIKTAA